MSEALSPIGKELQRLFPPPEMAPSHEERKQSINSTLASVEDALVELGLKFNVDEKRMHTLARDFCLHIETLVVSIGDLSEQHPVLRAILVSSVIAFIAPRISVWVLRPVLNLFGFGPAGPVKGSLAAWAQSTFLGAVIPKNSWFSLLQSAGMVKI
ncbi:hypothetical protein K474DRAFT_1657713 [Panus rudis PR-1116 ss-1]|nr:hypothetical protein K474DRAFT_1657713 [Panus rudis PR-1116 ss-1]